MYTAQVTNDAPIQINECDVVRTDIEADRFRRGNMQDG